MTPLTETALQTRDDPAEIAVENNHDGWVPNTSLLWDRRRTLARVFLCSLILSTIFAFLTPKEYESTTRMMPPEQQGMGTAMLAALTGKAMPGALGALAGGVLGMKDTGALFVELLHSGTIEGTLVDRFSYAPAFVAAGILPILATVALVLLIRTNVPAELKGE